MNEEMNVIDTAMTEDTGANVSTETSGGSGIIGKLIIGAVITGAAIGITKLVRKNSSKREEKQIAKLEKKGYIVTKSDATVIEADFKECDDVE